MGPFGVIDQWILDKYQRFGEWSQVRYRRNCYWWAYISSNVLGIICIVWIGLIFQEIVQSLERLPFYGIMAFSLLIVTAGQLFKLPRLKRWSAQSKPQQAINLPIFRLTWVSLTVWNLFGIEWGALFTFSLMCIDYFEQCMPLPPSEVRRRQQAGEESLEANKRPITA